MSQPRSTPNLGTTPLIGTMRPCVSYGPDTAMRHMRHPSATNTTKNQNWTPFPAPLKAGFYLRQCKSGATNMRKECHWYSERLPRDIIKNEHGMLRDLSHLSPLHRIVQTRKALRQLPVMLTPLMPLATLSQPGRTLGPFRNSYSPIRTEGTSHEAFAI